MSKTMQHKTYLTHRGYAIKKSDGTDALCANLRKELTVKPKLSAAAAAMTGKTDEEMTFPLFRESAVKFYVPRAFGIQTFGVPMQDALRNAESCERLVFRGTLRPEQEGPVNAFLKAANDPLRRGGVLVLPCAAGKTTISLHIASCFKKKTLVVCHKEFLISQWIERITQFLPDARIGRIQQKIIDIQDKDIVIASLQSVAMREYPVNMFESFHFSIFDEVHHTGAQVFSQALGKINTPVMLGLSATPKRKDGLSKVYEWYLGKPVFEVKKRSDTALVVDVSRYYDPHPDYGRELRMWNNQLNFAKMINNICAFEPRNRHIVKLLKALLTDEPNRQCLVLSERRSQLHVLNELLREAGITDTGFCMGGMSEHELKASCTKKVLLATYQLVSEGFDVPTLNAMVLASPISSIEQSIGRIQRQKPEDREYVPRVIDVVDEFSIFVNQGHRRIQYYIKNGYQVNDSRPSHDDASKEKEKGTYAFLSDDE